MIRLNKTIFLLSLGPLALAVGVLIGHWTPGFSGTTERDVPAAEVIFPTCRENPLSHVRRPTRFVVMSDCTFASGTVTQIEFQIQDGAYRILIKPDPQDEHLLAASNEGRLIAEVIAVDAPSVYLPSVGEHATFYGALVLDRGHDRRVEIQPTWLIATLDVSVDIPEDVAVGDSLRITVDVTSTRDGIARPVPEASLFLELYSDEGKSVRQEATRTNTLGEANINLATLEIAGGHTLLVHASKDQESGVGLATFKIKRR